MRRDVVIFLKSGRKVLLAHKKRGLGKGRLNGPGGKVEPGESFMEAVVRECREEIGIRPINPQKMAKIKFKEFDGRHQIDLDVEVFTATEWEGNPIETDEMAPEWFNITNLPFDEMWPDDIFWLPHILKGQRIKASFELDKNDRIISYSVKEVEKL
jgi:8-oxo-dGTP diphosphatase